MKKILTLVFVTLVALTVLSGCSGNKAGGSSEQLEPNTGEVTK